MNARIEPLRTLLGVPTASLLVSSSKPRSACYRHQAAVSYVPLPFPLLFCPSVAVGPFGFAKTFGRFWTKTLEIFNVGLRSSRLLSQQFTDPLPASLQCPPSAFHNSRPACAVSCRRSSPLGGPEERRKGALAQHSA